MVYIEYENKTRGLAKLPSFAGDGRETVKKLECKGPSINDVSSEGERKSKRELP